MRTSFETPQVREVSLRFRAFKALMAFLSILAFTSPLCRKNPKPRRPRLVTSATLHFLWWLTSNFRGAPKVTPHFRAPSGPLVRPLGRCRCRAHSDRSDDL